jgi:hypothetical protein
MVHMTSTDVRQEFGAAPRPSASYGPLGAQFTVRRDAASRSDGRVTDVLGPFDRVTARTDIFLANPTGGVHEPAVLAEFARRAVRNAAPIYDDPRDVLLRFDDLLAIDHPGVFVTALFATVRHAESVVSVSIANRGHALPILVSAGTARPVGLHGTILGARPYRNRQGELTRLTLRRTDQLVLINDRPIDVPIPQPLRPGVVNSLPLNSSDDELAEHVIAMYGDREIDVIVLSGSRSDD